MKHLGYLLTAGVVMLCAAGCEKAGDKGASKAQTAEVQKKSAKEATPSEKDNAKKTLTEAATPAAEKPAEEAVKAEPMPNVTSTNKIAATFDGGCTVPQEEVFRRIEMLPKKVRDGMPFTQLYNLVLFVVIQEHLAYQAALHEKLADTPEVSVRLKSMYEDYLQQMYLDEASKKLITDEALQQQYNNLVKEFKSEPEIELRHILVKTKEDAQKVLAELKAGRSFDSVQEKYTVDKEAQKNKGSLGYFKKAQLPKEQEREIMETAAGQVVQSPVNVPGVGYSILLVTNRRDSQPTPFEKVRDSIQSLVLKRLAMEHIGTLFKKYDVKIFDPTGQVIPVKTVDERLEEIRQRRQRKDQQPTAEEKKKESAINSLKDDSIVITIGSTEKITFKQLLEFIKEKKGLFKNLSEYEMYTTAAEEYANRCVLQKAVEEDGLAKTEDFKTKWEEAKRTFLYGEYLKNEAEKLLTEAELRKRYDQLIARIDPNEVEVGLRVIPVKTMEDGKKALKELKEGKTFESVLDSYCTEEEFKKRKGDLGYLRKEQLTRISPDLVKSVANAPKGTFLPEPILVNNRVLVVRVNDKKPITIPQYKDVRSYLRKNLIPDMKVQVTLNLIQSKNVKAFGFDGQPLNLSKDEIEKTLGGSQQIRN